MHATSAVALVAVLATAGAFAPATPLVAPRCTASMKMALRPDDFVPSELFMQQYLGQDGIRYSMGKTPQEIETEGDYGFFEAIFGQTSNNAAKKELKKQARESAKKVLYTERAKEWLVKYGYPRAFPAYVDISGEDPAESAPVVKAAMAAVAEPVAAVKAAAPKIAAMAKKAAATVKAAPAAAAAKAPVIERRAPGFDEELLCPCAVSSAPPLGPQLDHIGSTLCLC
eukprot:TRINITY_DN14918_c0_g1_i1.p1 TRINITY_DN14918_c0_g1~~TRINITY_DN14918_c0_g1_i1.p1  ORF type:complete len:227 (-),score=63.25 TRINITY_DN14918_c0_g1_i1:28-708(-)